MWQFKREEPGWIALHSLLQAALFAENDAGHGPVRAVIQEGYVRVEQPFAAWNRGLRSLIHLVVTQPQSEDKEFP